MPTYEVLPRFTADLHRLTPAQRRRFRQAVAASTPCAPDAGASVPACG
ncbi:hypothetical protein [Streptomyces fradiae]